MKVFRLNHLDRVKSNSSHGLPTPFFPAGLGRHREEKEMTVTGNISHCLFKFGVSIKNPAPNSLFFFFSKHCPQCLCLMWLFSWAATQPKENPEFNQTYLQHLNEESEAGWRPTEPRERVPLTAPAWVGLTHLSTQGLHPLSDRIIEKPVGPEAVNQRT